MSKLSYIKIPIQLYADKRLCEIQRAILGLATAFGNRGLKMPDDDLASVFNVSRQWINKLISELKSQGYVRIEKAGSKYRVIYCQGKSTVQGKLLSSIVDSKSVLLSTPTCSTVNSESTHKERSNKRARRTKKPVCDNGAFEGFWEAYPKKQKKLDAQKAWAKLNPDPELVERILKDVRQRAQSFDWQKENGKYVPMPTTYLNGQRWTDELPEPKRGDPDWLPDEREAEALMKEAGL